MYNGNEQKRKAPILETVPSGLPISRLFDVMKKIPNSTEGGRASWVPTARSDGGSRREEGHLRVGVAERVNLRNSNERRRDSSSSEASHSRSDGRQSLNRLAGITGPEAATSADGAHFSLVITSDRSTSAEAPFGSRVVPSQTGTMDRDGGTTDVRTVKKKTNRARAPSECRPRRKTTSSSRSCRCAESVRESVAPAVLSRTVRVSVGD
ncbi:unnamed protein product, partial [Iphiclides podalirius]